MSSIRPTAWSAEAQQGVSLSETKSVAQKCSSFSNICSRYLLLTTPHTCANILQVSMRTCSSRTLPTLWHVSPDLHALRLCRDACWGRAGRCSPVSPLRARTTPQEYRLFPPRWMQAVCLMCGHPGRLPAGCCRAITTAAWGAGAWGGGTAGAGGLGGGAGGPPGTPGGRFASPEELRFPSG